MHCLMLEASDLLLQNSPEIGTNTPGVSRSGLGHTHAIKI
jgi:hypothetical protein